MANLSVTLTGDRELLLLSLEFSHQKEDPSCSFWKVAFVFQPDVPSVSHQPLSYPMYLKLKIPQNDTAWHWGEKKQGSPHIPGGPCPSPTVFMWEKSWLIWDL